MSLQGATLEIEPNNRSGGGVAILKGKIYQGINLNFFTYIFCESARNVVVATLRHFYLF